MEAARQDVDQEATDELVDGERHQLGAVAPVGAVVLPPEGHAGVVEGDEPAVGDGDAVVSVMGVRPEVGLNTQSSDNSPDAVIAPLIAPRTACAQRSAARAV